MKNLNNYIFEKLNVKNISANNIKRQYSCRPKTKDELRKILKERLKENKNADLNDIDVSEITNMDYLFYGLDPHNIDISEWDVSNVINMRSMFIYCWKFNSDLSKWDVSNVTNMFDMINGCKEFNSDLSKWDVSNVTDMRDMFYNCDSLKNKPSWYKE